MSTISTFNPETVLMDIKEKMADQCTGLFGALQFHKSIFKINWLMCSCIFHSGYVKFLIKVSSIYSTQHFLSFLSVNSSSISHKVWVCQYYVWVSVNSISLRVCVCVCVFYPPQSLYISNIWQEAYGGCLPLNRFKLDWRAATVVSCCETHKQTNTHTHTHTHTLKDIVPTLWAHFLSCRESDEKIDTTLVSVQYEATAKRQLA